MERNNHAEKQYLDIKPAGNLGLQGSADDLDEEGYIVDLQANNIGAYLVYSTARTHNYYIHFHLYKNSKIEYAWFATRNILLERHYNVELFCRMHNKNGHIF